MTDYNPWSYDDYVKAGKALIEAEYPELLLTLKERGELVTRQARIIQEQQARIAELEAALNNIRKMAVIIFDEEYSPYANLRTLVHDFAKQIEIAAIVQLDKKGDPE